ncbi:MAG: choice-of-anchor Q domain-containing protein [Kiritimatiellia bacterium]
MANEVLDLQDLAEGAEIQRRMYNRMTPPGFSWLQPMFPSVAPFDAGYFDESFLDGLLGEDRNSVAVYPLSLVLDPETRETLVYNAEGKLIASVPADGVSRTWTDDADPARVTLQLDLLPSEDVEPYLYVGDRIAKAEESVASKSAKSPRTGGIILKSLGVGEFGFADAETQTNGNMRLTVTNGTDMAEVYSYTVWHTSSVVVVTWTNEESNVVTETNTLWTPVSSPYNGLDNEWECGTTNLVLTNGVGVWEDSNISSNAKVRFYGAAKRTDTDEDGLTDGAEYFVHHTSPASSDTDEDGMPDGWETTNDLNPLVVDAGLDHDEDGFINYEEYIASTDPASPLSHPGVCWYVATNGVDVIGGGSYTNPLATLTNAFAQTQSGQRVILMPGVYFGEGNRAVNFNGKDIIVSGVPGHRNETVIDCEGIARAFQADSGETVAFQYLTICNGSNEWGGAIVVDGNSLTLRSCNFVSNSAIFGGAISCLAPLDIEDCVFDGNSATNQGGAVYSEADLSCADSRITGNTSKAEGGAIYSSAGEAFITSCEFDGNQAATTGGAIYCVNDLLLANCLFNANTSTGSAGAVYMESGVFTAESCDFTGNAASNDGGAVYGSVIVATNCSFTSNSAVRAGAVYATYELNVSGCRFIANEADGEGGAIYLIPHFNGNSGSILDGSRFEGNLAYEGGALFLDQNSATTTMISRCHFQNNEASHIGGAVKASSPCFVGNSLFKSNSAPLAAALCAQYICMLQNCTVVHNAASYPSSDRAIISQYGSSPLFLENTIISGNTLPVIYLDDYEAFPLSYTNCCLQDGMDLPVRGASFYQNPRLGIDGLHLSSNSPCIDAGRNLAGMDSQTDLDGQSRIWGGTVDVGADESGASDVDDDSDSMPDWWEIHFGLDPANPADSSGDADGDVLTNLLEYQHGADPRVSDSDGDGLADGVEVSMGLDPAISDTDDDGLSDGWEVSHGLNPLLSDSDEDGIIDGLQDTDQDGIGINMELLLGLSPDSYDELPDAGTWATSETSLGIYAPQQPCD